MSYKINQHRSKNYNQIFFEIFLFVYIKIKFVRTVYYLILTLYVDIYIERRLAEFI